MAHVEKRRQESAKGTLGRATYRVRYLDPSGRQRSRSFKKRADAERFKKTVEADVLRGDWHDPALGRKTFREWVNEYMASANKRATTRARDDVVLRKHFLPVLGDLPLGSITPRDIQLLVDKLVETTAPATVRTNYGVLRAVFSAAVQADLIPRSPCRARGVKSPSTTRKRRKGLDVADVVRLADAMPEEYRPMVYVFVLSLHFSEVAGLKVRDIDFLRHELHVVETVAEVNGHIQPADTKNPTRRRRMAVPPFIIAMLAEHLARTGRNDPDDYVFQAPKGGPVRYTNFRTRIWMPAVEKAGLAKTTTYTLRHTSGGLLRQVGVHTQVIQQRLGHSSSRTTTDVYGWVPDETDQEAAAALETLFTEAHGLSTAYEDGA